MQLLLSTTGLTDLLVPAKQARNYTLQISVAVEYMYALLTEIRLADMGVTRLPTNTFLKNSLLSCLPVSSRISGKCLEGKKRKPFEKNPSIRNNCYFFVSSNDKQKQLLCVPVWMLVLWQSIATLICSGSLVLWQESNSWSSKLLLVHTFCGFLGGVPSLSATVGCVIYLGFRRNVFLAGRRELVNVKNSAHLFHSFSTFFHSNDKEVQVGPA